jgi:monofunctional biosynthetic peptidoglycan transglycosylase
MRPEIRVVGLAVLALVLLPYILTPFYYLGHPVSTLMIGRWLIGVPVTRTWIGIDAMSQALPRSAVAAEDAQFCFHHGIDWDSLRERIEDAEDGEVVRGGSTITQQVTKNLFLWPGRSFIRKGLEFPLALWVDLVLSKRRILELYLNIAELGPTGQFGVEAASQYAFARSAAAVSAQEAAVLVATLPNPVTRSARQPGPAVRRMAGIYMARAQSAEISNCWSRNR